VVRRSGKSGLLNINLKPYNIMDKQEMKTAAKKSIDELFHKIDELESQTEKASGALKAKYEETVSTLKSRKTELKSKYEALNNASEEKWEDARHAFEKSATHFKEGLKELRSVVA
jgi:chromosome segregation ATPase